MKKYILITITLLSLMACSKWTETESNAEKFEEVALSNLREVRDNFKWQKEAEITNEAKLALEEYWAQLREYKRRAWLNGGDAVGQKPMFYFWYAGGRWQATPGIASSWLQAIPDSVACISLWGGFGKRPEQISEKMKKDLEVFHKKGSAVLLCWQTPSVGLGLIGPKDNKDINGYTHFRNKYPFAENYSKWPEIYARDLSRYIIACDFDGYDVDWETCGDHTKVFDTEEQKKEAITLMIEDNNYENIVNFVKEMGKYFGPVGPEFYVKTQEQRQANIKALFDANTPGFHPNEKEYIEEFKPYLPENYLTKRYYFCADVPCGTAPPVFGNYEQFRLYFDKHFLQDYTVAGVGTHIKQLGGVYYNSAGLDIQTKRSSDGFQRFWEKGRAIKEKKIWGFGLYHGELDYDSGNKTPELKNYLKMINQTRNYHNHAITREIIRIADPRESYSNFKESEPLIVIP
ncbi:glycoside hydrolase family 18 protein [Capnocytophaga canimorsus]|uniref:hypothetical protein n=1 Tax=Capnocytophaga canimorsus TaxID=28188 RepID=UPI000D6DE120|nr:hypothetical protein [Capnocytophaga canimorsus]AWL77487.1 hypothetical protein DKB58_00115 [Capnocytophaga canimorsus]AYW36040.1 hypothetical protein D8L92_00970 [Capnocytophaga canimorsus]MDT9498480.1 hypothetical protein [Capnocytophaga canimorsus]